MQEERQTSFVPLTRLTIAALLVAIGMGSQAEEPAACHEVGISSAEAAQASTPEAATVESGLANSPILAGGFRAYIDPQTGALVVPPPATARALELSPAVQEAFSTSAEGLVEVTLPDGTVKVRLEGRFKSGAFATIGEDGVVRVGHGVPPIVAPPQKADAEAKEGSAIDENP